MSSQDDSPQMDDVLPLGAKILRRYKIESFLYRKGDYQVYEVGNILTGSSEFSLRILSQEKVDDAHSFAKFEKEARFLAGFSHPNLIRLYDYGISESGRPFMLFERLSGKTLAEYICENRSISYHAALPVFAQLCDLLSAAHKAGIIHRQLSPDRVFLAFNKPLQEFVKVVDFSCARYIKDRHEETAAPFLNHDLPAYISPEQLKGKKQDSRTDLWSLSALLYEMLSGQPAFTGKQLRAHLLHAADLKLKPLEIQDPDDRLPAGLEDLLKAALSQYADERPQSAESFKKEMLFTLGLDSVQKLDELLDAARAYLFANL